MVHIVGPIRAYTILDRVLKKIRSSLSLNDISVLSPLSSEFQSLREEALGPGRLGMGPATGHAAGVITFHDAYLYTLSPVRTREWGTERVMAVTRDQLTATSDWRVRK